MPEGKTIKQIADELGVSKQAVHQKRKGKELSTALQSFTTTVDGVVYVSVDGEKLIKAAFIGQQTVNEPTTVYDNGNPTVDALISMLKTELDGKNQQISGLMGELAKERDELAAERAHGRELAEKVAVLADQAQRLQLAQISTSKPAEISNCEDLQQGRKPGLLARLFGERNGNR